MSIRGQYLRSFTTAPFHQQQADGITSLLDVLEQPTSTQGTIAPTTRSSIAKPRPGQMQHAPRTGGRMTHENIVDELATADLTKELGRQASRVWKVGDVYAPHDLSSVEASKWKVNHRRPEKDVFDMLGENPIKHYKVLSDPSFCGLDTESVS
jgi:small subunit ribosomal protein S18